MPFVDDPGPTRRTHHTERTALTRAAVAELFAPRVGQFRAPASVFAVFDRQGIIYSGGYGDRGDGRVPTIDTAFRIASCSKSFTAAALMIMVERGLVELDDPVVAHLDLGPLIGPDGAEVPAPTLRQLVAMAGGLPSDDPWADRQESLSAARFRDLVTAGVRFSRAPGSGYEYSNLGFALVGAVIEQVSGRSFVDVVTTELIEPLGLTGIGYDDRVGGADGVATGYARFDDSWEQQPVTGPGAFSPIGGVFATASALTRWIGWLSAAGSDHEVGGDAAVQPLSRESRLLLQTAHTPLPRSASDTHAYGMGLRVDENSRHGTIVAHSGGYPGFGSHMRWHLASGVGVLAFENGRYSGPHEPVSSALQLILDETVIPTTEPTLWPETAAARDGVERLVRTWDQNLAEHVFADNVDLDEPLGRRAARIATLAGEVDPGPEPLPLIDSAPVSETPAHLAWTIPGRRGSLRCELSMTPTEPPRIQTVDIRPG